MNLAELTANKSRFHQWLCFGVVAISLTIIGHWTFLTGNRLYWHDSLAAMINMHLFYDSLFRGFLPLWSPEINGGQPLWTQVETMPSFDLVAMAVWTMAHILHQKSTIAYQWTCTLWLTIFSCSGMLCSRYLYKNWWINFVVFILLFSGPVSTSMPAQSYGLLIPFRYTPLVVLFFLWFLDRPSYKRAMALGLSIGLSSAGYQTPYALLFLALFAVTYAVFALWRGTFFLTARTIRFSIVTLFIAGIVMSPTIIACFKMLKLFAVARTYFTSGYLYSTDNFFRELLAPLFYCVSMPQRWLASGDIGLPSKILQTIAPFYGWHGSGYIGIIPTFVCLSIPLIAGSRLLSRWHKGHPESFSGLELTWMVVTLLCVTISLDKGIFYAFEQESFLGLRNWGFTITLVIFSFSQLVAIGFKHLAVVINNSSILSRHFQWLRHKPDRVGSMVFLLVAINFATFSAQNNYTGFSPDLLASALGNFPEPGAIETFFVNRRQLDFDITPFAPFHYEGPSVIHQHFAFIPPTSNYATQVPVEVTPITHQFRLPRYNNLLSARLKDEVVFSVLGVTTPIIHDADSAVVAGNEQEAVMLLGKVISPARLENIPIIEGDIPKPMQREVSSLAEPQTDTSAHVSHWQIKSFSPNRLIIDVNFDKQGLLIFADNYDESWKVFVDQRKEPLLIANATNKAVLIAKGQHLVEFIYRPMLYLISFWARAIVVGLGIVYCIAKGFLMLKNATLRV